MSERKKCKRPGCDNPEAGPGRGYCSRECSPFGHLSDGGPASHVTGILAQVNRFRLPGEMTSGEAADALGVTQDTVLNHFRRGIISGRRDPRGWAHFRIEIVRQQLMDYGWEFSQDGKAVPRKHGTRIRYWLKAEGRR